MADPIIKIKRSSVEGKIPTPDQLPIGEIALNTYDGKLYASKNVGIGTTVFVVNPWSVGTGTNTYDSYFTNGNVGIGTTNPPDKLTVSGKIQIQQDSGSNNRLVFRGQPGSSYRWNVDNYSSSNEFRIYREDDLTSANGSVAVSISTTGTVTATKFSGDGSLLTNLPTGGGGGSSSQWVTTSAGIHTLSNVGIGTTNPTQKLEVVGGEIKAGRIDSSSEGGQLSFGRSTDNANAWYIDVYGNTSTPDLRFVDVSNAAIRAVIDGSGNFGLNTALPTSRLDVVGDAKVSGVVTATTFIGNLTGTATTATNLANAANITTGTINSARLSGTYNISISGNAASATYATSAGIATYATTAGIATYATLSGLSTYASTAGVATYASSSGIATYASTAGIATNATYATSSGIATYATSAGIATNATKLQTARTFEITGDVVSSAISFDGSGNVSLAATIQPNSVALGSDTTGDYVSNITGTSNQITVTSGTGEGSTPTLSIPNQFTVPQDIIVTRDIQVNRNLNVTGNITIGGTAAFINAAELRVSDPDIVLGFRTDSNGNDNTTDNTANHGGIAVASTEGTPLVNLFIAGIETNPATYKKIMWFKAGTFAGLGTDAWISNYAIGIGSTQVPNGVRLAAGGMQVTDSTVRTPQLSVSGVSTFTGAVSFGTSAYFGDNDPLFFGDGNDLTIRHDGSNSYIEDLGTGQLLLVTNNILSIVKNGGENLSIFRADGAVELYYDNVKEFETTGYGATVFGVLQSQGLQVSGVSTFTGGSILVGSATSTGTASQPLQVTGGAYISGNLGVGNTNPGAKLDVTGDIRLSAADPEIEFNTGGPRLKVPASNTLTIHTGGGLNTTSNEVIRINNTGIGIGTANPQEELHIAGVSTVAGISTSGDIFIEGGLIRNYEFTDYANLDSKLIWRRYSSGSSNPTTTEGLTDLIKAATFVSQGTTANITGFTFSADAYSVEFVGYFYAATTGLYTFGVNSDDASDLFIDGKLVAYHYGGHGAASSGTPSIGGTQLTAYLKKGYHRLYTRFQENSGGDIHEILYKTPGSGTFAVIPASVLFHHPTDLIAGVGDNISIMSGSVGIGTTRPISNLHVVGNALVTGIVTASGGFNLGISSAGTSITSGPVTRLNFIGAGNTFAVNGTTVDISIAGGGGGSSVSISTVAPSSPTAGDLWYNSNLGRTFIYYNDGSSSQWVDAAPFNPAEPSSTPGKTSSSFTATEGQTSFSVSYTVGYIDVFLNGVRLNTSEFTASNGSSIVLLEGATAGDVLDVVEYRMGIGDTGATGSGGPLSNITQTTSSSTFYPIIATGTGSTLPYITTTSNYFEFTPSSGTLEVNQLVVAGVTTATDFNSTSDRNLKENINIIEDPLEKLVGISGVTFNWKESKESSAGVIAQDVEKVLPEIVKSNDDMKTVNYNGLIGLLVEAVKNQQDQINSLTERIKSLEGN